MSKRGKSIELYLMDGESGGRMKCTLANWTGVAYKIPRTELDQCKERDDLKQGGVYFLFGTFDQTGLFNHQLNVCQLRNNYPEITNK